MDTYYTVPKTAYGDERLDDASTFTRTFFGAVIERCNDIGLFEGDAGAFTLSLGGGDPADVEEQMKELERREIIERYQAPGRRRLVGIVLRFHEWEGHPNRVAFASQRTKSTLPNRDGTFFQGRGKKDSDEPEQDDASVRKSVQETRNESTTERKKKATPSKVGGNDTQELRNDHGEPVQESRNTVRKSVQETRKQGGADVVAHHSGSDTAATMTPVHADSDETLVNGGSDPSRKSYASPRKSVQDSIAERSEAKRSVATATLASLATRTSASPVTAADSPTDALGRAPLASIGDEDQAPGFDDPEIAARNREAAAALRLKFEGVRPRAAPDLRVIDGGKSDADIGPEPEPGEVPLSPEEDAAELARAQAACLAKRAARDGEP